MTFGTAAYGTQAFGAADSPGVIYQRVVTLEAGGAVDAIRGAKTSPRTTSLEATGAVDAIRGAKTSPRTTSLEATGTLTTATQFREAFPSELTRDLSWDFDPDRMGLVSEWADRIAAPGHGDVALYLEGTLGTADPCTPSAVVEADYTGDGTIDEQSHSRTIPGIEQVVVYPELAGRTGSYRILLQDLRPGDIITAVVFGPSHT